MHGLAASTTAVVAAVLTLGVALAAPTQTEPWLKGMPLTTTIRWFHTPKCGTSFGLTLMHWCCPRIPEDEDMHTDASGVYHKVAEIEFVRAKFTVFTDPQHVCDCNPRRLVPGHQAPDFEMDAGSIVGLFREPLERSVSLFYYWTKEPHPMNLSDPDDVLAQRFHNFVQNPRKQVKNMYMRMLLERPGNENEDSPTFSEKPFTEADYNLAIRRLTRDFAFVGLTSQFNRSVCLFHAINGRSPRKVQFMHTRKGTGRNDRSRETQNSYGLDTYEDEIAFMRARGWNDQFDEGIYNLAQKMFYDALEKHPQCW